MNNNAILTLASGYDYHQLSPFVTSLKATGYSGSIIFFISNLSDETKAKLMADGIELIDYYSTPPFINISGTVALPQLKKAPDDKSSLKLRHILYYIYLQQYKDKYQNILLTDVRDVVFQKDPFDFDFKGGLYCFMEDDSTTIGKEYYNSLWIKGGYGTIELDRIGDRIISCAGVTIGDMPSMLNYLENMIVEIYKVDKECVDQGIHNYLIYANKLPKVILVPDDEGPVTTLSSFKSYSKIRFDDRGLIVNKKGIPVNIIHQYDRHLSLLWKYNRKTFWQRLINLNKKRFYFLKVFYNKVFNNK